MPARGGFADVEVVTEFVPPTAHKSRQHLTLAPGQRLERAS